MSEQFRLVVGSDDAGLQVKDAVKAGLEQDGRVDSVVDVCVHADDTTPNPDIAVRAARMIAAGEADRALLVRGTGRGVAISASKVEGIRAVTAHHGCSVERSVLSTNAQALCFGQRVVGLEIARRLAREWLGYRLEESSASAEKVARITHHEQEANAVAAR